MAPARMSEDATMLASKGEEHRASAVQQVPCNVK
jgi:hypothetical protein